MNIFIRSVKRFFAGFLIFIICQSGARGGANMQEITVKHSDTLWSITRTYLKDPKKWPEIIKYNKLPFSNPSRVLPEMILKVPINLIKNEYKAAKVVYYEGNVFFRKSGGIKWKKAMKNMNIYRGDTLRLGADGRADILFYTGELLNLYPKSTVIVKPIDKKAKCKLILGKIGGAKFRVATPSVMIVPITKDAYFDTEIQNDFATVIRVGKGRVLVEAREKTVEVSEGFSLEVKKGMPPLKPVKQKIQEGI